MLDRDEQPQSSPTGYFMLRAVRPLAIATLAALIGATPTLYRHSVRGYILGLSGSVLLGFLSAGNGVSEREFLPALLIGSGAAVVIGLYFG
jgi:hypothetical protein